MNAGCAWTHPAKSNGPGGPASVAGSRSDKKPGPQRSTGLKTLISNSATDGRFTRSMTEMDAEGRASCAFGTRPNLAGPPGLANNF